MDFVLSFSDVLEASLECVTGEEKTLSFPIPPLIFHHHKTTTAFAAYPGLSIEPILDIYESSDDNDGSSSQMLQESHSTSAVRTQKQIFVVVGLSDTRM